MFRLLPLPLQVHPFQTSQASLTTTSCQYISQTKGHNTPFKGAIAGAEGGFLFITFRDSNEVAGMLQVNFGIHGGLSWAVEEVGDTQKWISVFLCDFVEVQKSVQRQRELSFFQAKRIRAP